MPDLNQIVLPNHKMKSVTKTYLVATNLEIGLDTLEVAIVSDKAHFRVVDWSISYSNKTISMEFFGNWETWEIQGNVYLALWEYNERRQQQNEAS